MQMLLTSSEHQDSLLYATILNLSSHLVIIGNSDCLYAGTYKLCVLSTSVGKSAAGFVCLCLKDLVCLGSLVVYGVLLGFSKYDIEALGFPYIKLTLAGKVMNSQRTVHIPLTSISCTD